MSKGDADQIRAALGETGEAVETLADDLASVREGLEAQNVGTDWGNGEFLGLQTWLTPTPRSEAAADVAIVLQRMEDNARSVAEVGDDIATSEHALEAETIDQSAIPVVANVNDSIERQIETLRSTHAVEFEEGAVFAATAATYKLASDALLHAADEGNAIWLISVVMHDIGTEAEALGIEYAATPNERALTGLEDVQAGAARSSSLSQEAAAYLGEMLGIDLGTEAGIRALERQTGRFTSSLNALAILTGLGDVTGSMGEVIDSLREGNLASLEDFRARHQGLQGHFRMAAEWFAKGDVPIASHIGVAIYGGIGGLLDFGYETLNGVKTLVTHPSNLWNKEFYTGMWDGLFTSFTDLNPANLFNGKHGDGKYDGLMGYSGSVGNAAGAVALSFVGGGALAKGFSAAKSVAAGATIRAALGAEFRAMAASGAGSLAGTLDVASRAASHVPGGAKAAARVAGAADHVADWGKHVGAGSSLPTGLASNLAAHTDQLVDLRRGNVAELGIRGAATERLHGLADSVRSIPANLREAGHVGADTARAGADVVSRGMHDAGARAGGQVAHQLDRVAEALPEGPLRDAAHSAADSAHRIGAKLEVTPGLADGARFDPHGAARELGNGVPRSFETRVDEAGRLHVVETTPDVLVRTPSGEWIDPTAHLADPAPGGPTPKPPLTVADFDPQLVSGTGPAAAPDGAPGAHKVDAVLTRTEPWTPEGERAVQAVDAVLHRTDPWGNPLPSIRLADPASVDQLTSVVERAYTHPRHTETFTEPTALGPVGQEILHRIETGDGAWTWSRDLDGLDSGAGYERVGYKLHVYAESNLDVAVVGERIAPVLDDINANAKFRNAVQSVEGQPKGVTIYLDPDVPLDRSVQTVLDALGPWKDQRLTGDIDLGGGVGLRYDGAIEPGRFGDLVPPRYLDESGSLRGALDELDGALRDGAFGDPAPARAGWSEIMDEWATRRDQQLSALTPNSVEGTLSAREVGAIYRDPSIPEAEVRARLGLDPAPDPVAAPEARFPETRPASELDAVIDARNEWARAESTDAYSFDELPSRAPVEFVVDAARTDALVTRIADSSPVRIELPVQDARLVVMKGDEFVGQGGRVMDSGKVLARDLDVYGDADGLLRWADGTVVEGLVVHVHASPEGFVLDVGGDLVRFGPHELASYLDRSGALDGLADGAPVTIAGCELAGPVGQELANVLGRPVVASVDIVLLDEGRIGTMIYGPGLAKPAHLVDSEWGHSPVPNSWVRFDPDASASAPALGDLGAGPIDDAWAMPHYTGHDPLPNQYFEDGYLPDDLLTSGLRDVVREGVDRAGEGLSSLFRIDGTGPVVADGAAGVPMFGDAAGDVLRAAVEQRPAFIDDHGARVVLDDRYAALATTPHILLGEDVAWRGDVVSIPGTVRAFEVTGADGGRGLVTAEHASRQLERLDVLGTDRDLLVVGDQRSPTLAAELAEARGTEVRIARTDVTSVVRGDDVHLVGHVEVHSHELLMDADARYERIEGAALDGTGRTVEYRDDAGRIRLFADADGGWRQTLLRPDGTYRNVFEAVTPSPLDGTSRLLHEARLIGGEFLDGATGMIDDLPADGRLGAVRDRLTPPGGVHLGEFDPARYVIDPTIEPPRRLNPIAGLFEIEDHRIFRHQLVERPAASEVIVDLTQGRPPTIVLGDGVRPVHPIEPVYTSEVVEGLFAGDPLAAEVHRRGTEAVAEQVRVQTQLDSGLAIPGYRVVQGSLGDVVRYDPPAWFGPDPVGVGLLDEVPAPAGPPALERRPDEFYRAGQEIVSSAGTDPAVIDDAVRTRMAYEAIADESVAAAHRALVPVLEDLDAARELTGGEFIGLDHAVKSRDSTLDALARDNGALPGDSLRFTVAYAPDGFGRGVEGITRELQARGYSPIRWQDTFGSEHYQGLNTRWDAPGHPVVEIQFHTRASFALKDDVTHAFYGAKRHPVLGAETAYIGEGGVPVTYAQLHGEMNRVLGARLPQPDRSPANPLVDPAIADRDR